MLVLIVVVDDDDDDDEQKVWMTKRRSLAVLVAEHYPDTSPCFFIIITFEKMMTEKDSIF